MCTQTRDDPIHVTVEDASRIADCLANAKLNVVLGQRRGRPAQPGYPHLERDAGSVRGPLKEHRDVPALERAFSPTPSLDRMRKVEHLTQLRRLEISDVEEVAAQKTAH